MALGTSAGSSRTFGSYELIIEVSKSKLGALWVATTASDTGERRGLLLRRVSGVPEDVLVEIERAAQRAQTIHNPLVLSGIDVFRAGAELGIVTEYLPAETLRSLLRLSSFKHKPIAAGIALRICLELLHGLDALHATASDAGGPIVGGLTPDSVLVGSDGHSRLFDAGLAARTANLDQIGRQADMIGYAAPETLDGAGDVRSDIFSAGVLLWEMLTGRRLFLGASFNAVADKVRACSVQRLDNMKPAGGETIPQAAADIAARALERNPEARFTRAKEMIAAIEASRLAAEPSQVTPLVENFAGTSIRARDNAVKRAVSDSTGPTSRASVAPRITPVANPPAYRAPSRSRPPTKPPPPPPPLASGPGGRSLPPPPPRRSVGPPPPPPPRRSVAPTPPAAEAAELNDDDALLEDDEAGAAAPAAVAPEPPAPVAAAPEVPAPAPEPAPVEAPAAVAAAPPPDKPVPAPPPEFSLPPLAQLPPPPTPPPPRTEGSSPVNGAAPPAAAAAVSEADVPRHHTQLLGTPAPVINGSVPAAAATSEPFERGPSSTGSAWSNAKRGLGPAWQRSRSVLAAGSSKLAPLVQALEKRYGRRKLIIGASVSGLMLLLALVAVFSSGSEDVTAEKPLGRDTDRVLESSAPAAAPAPVPEPPPAPPPPPPEPAASAEPPAAAEQAEAKDPPEPAAEDPAPETAKAAESKSATDGKSTSAATKTSTVPKPSGAAKPKSKTPRKFTPRGI